MKCSFSTFNRKILNLTIPIVCSKNLSQSDCTDCKIITIIEGEEKVLLVESLDCCQCLEIQ
jgi:hypothetical protein